VEEVEEELGLAEEEVDEDGEEAVADDRSDDDDDDDPAAAAADAAAAAALIVASSMSLVCGSTGPSPFWYWLPTYTAALVPCQSIGRESTGTIGLGLSASLRGASFCAFLAAFFWKASATALRVGRPRMAEMK
jgi:hypothetical protein